jgi:hypothetical protein
MAEMQGTSGGGDDAARSRGAQRRPKPQRPRDELGRLLPAGSANRLVLPDFDVLSLEQNHALAIELFDAGNYFGAHEAWETCWQQARGADDEEFFKGLSQLGAGYTHYRRGNAHGAQTLLGRALSRIGGRGSPHRGIDVDALASAVAPHAAAFARAEHDGEPPPAVAPPRITRAG